MVLLLVSYFAVIQAVCTYCLPVLDHWVPSNVLFMKGNKKMMVHCIDFPT